MNTLAAIAAGAGAIGLATGGMLYASVWPTSQIYGRTLVAGSDPGEIALTFDDGPNDSATPALLEVLARYNVRATFFSIGGFVRERPDLLRAVAAAGHAIGNHTMTHPKLSFSSATQIRRELAECNAVLEDILGKPICLFRPPFGARRPVVLRIARELGLTPVMWNVTGYDWSPIGAEKILGKLEAGIARNRAAGQGSNLLLHDGGHLGIGAPRMDTVRAVERLLKSHMDGHASFVTVDSWMR
ncbi:MAG TPA: polysaccharide deacetylase family protein [Acidobacteriaceae bacterium]|nr:polysaccharide deacetylase family protein [Acidobacteriaceae bacterium]